MENHTESTAQNAQLNGSEPNPGNPPPGFPPIVTKPKARARKAKATSGQQSQTVKRRGRPKGATNRKFAEVLELPATCPRCGSPKLTMVRGKAVVEREIAGEVLGQKFDRVAWRDTKCECGQLVRIRQYLRKKK